MTSQAKAAASALGRSAYYRNLSNEYEKLRESYAKLADHYEQEAQKQGIEGFPQPIRRKEHRLEQTSTAEIPDFG